MSRRLTARILVAATLACAVAWFAAAPCAAQNADSTEAEAAPLTLPEFFPAPAASSNTASPSASNAATERASPEAEATTEHPHERVAFLEEGRHRSIAGRILVASRDGGVLLQSNDGGLWPIEGERVISRTPLDEPFEPLSQEAIADQVRSELPAGFRVHTTAHYVVLYDTSQAYARWTSSLLERLHRAFVNYWTRRGFEMREPEFPLVVTVFADHASYQAAGRDELGAAARNIVGYYSLRTNRVSMFDLTGAETLRDGDNRRGSLREITAMLSRPPALQLVATIVHEATHQIAFNCGMQTRFADLPLWLCEGMAVYFEAPDVTSTRGWRGIGSVNYTRLRRFLRVAAKWEPGSLPELLADDRQFRDPGTALDAYAVAWALNYYLIERRPREFTAYLETLSQKPPLLEDGPQKRLAEFEAHFGDLAELERDFLEQMQRVR